MAAPLGAIVEDLDVRTVGEEEAATLNQLFGEHHVLVFPKQELTPMNKSLSLNIGANWCPFLTAVCLATRTSSNCEIAAKNAT